jgi:Fic family protein
MFQYTDSGFGGKFKNVPNYISAKDEDGKQFILFTPLSPFETPEAMQQLCDSYNIAIGEGKVDPLLLIPAFIHDFLCIHPFVDGNGRMSRLLTTLLLYRNGYFVGRYISLEAKIAGNKDFYYDALLRSQCGWHEGKDDPVPFIKYLLAIIIGAYRDFEERVELVDEKLPAIDMVRNAVCLKIGKFKKADILELCPTLSAASVERSLKALCQSKEISKHQSGKATYYLREML